MTSVSELRILVLFIYTNVLFLVASAAYRTLQFADTKQTYSVLEGDTIRILCNPRDIENFFIFSAKSTLVSFGILNEALSDEFAFEYNETSCALTIKQIERKHGEEYDCRFPKGFLMIRVLSSPSHDYPVCNSSYTNNTFFLDSFQEPFKFSCLSGEANPPVNISLSVNHGDAEINNINEENATIYITNEAVLLSYSPYLDSSFNNSTFVCTVTQQLPAPYQSYNKSCSFGPLMLLPTFSVSIHPSHYTVTANSPEDITLMCTSNVSGVVLDWTNIPLDDWDYTITRINDSLQLEIFDYGPRIDLPITIRCNGSYGGKTVSRYATIDSASADKQIHPPTIIIIIIIAAVVIVIIIAIIVVLLIGENRKRKIKKRQLHALSLTDTAGQTHSPNDNNANNVNVGPDEVNDDRHSPLNDAASNMTQDDSKMVDNPIYGSNRKQTSDFGRISDESNSSIEMTGNVVYESYKPKTLRMEENQEEGNYATVSV